MKTFRDFDIRSEFIDYLGLYEKNANTGPDFHKIANVSQNDYQLELDHIYRDIETIKETWNNQSIDQIEQSVSKKGPRQLEIMKGQKEEKLRAGYKPNQPMYRIKNCGPDSFFTHLAKQIGLEQALARYHVQFPGEVTAWHTDIYSPAHEFLSESAEDQSDESIGQDKNIRRILIALEDWRWGQFLQFGMSPWFDWKAGDMIYWKYGVPHGGANMGYVPRISVSITGLITDKFMGICQNAFPK